MSQSQLSAWSLAGTRNDRVLPVAVVLALIYGSAALAMMLMAPKVPYADVWRFLGHFLQAGFPQDVVTPDNGHHELLPNVVRVLELRLLKGGQWLQTGCGIALLAGTLLVSGRSIRTLPQPHLRSAAWLAVLMGLCWLGNARALGHANETVHAYAVTLFLICGITALSCRTGTTAGAWIAGMCGLGAAFSFGSGIAVFAAFFAVLLLRRSSWRSWCVLVAMTLLTAWLLHWTGGSASSLSIAPVAQGRDLLRWLAGPAIYGAWPALDPAVAAHVPGVLRGPVLEVAEAYQRMAGPVMLARWPHLLIGICGLAWWVAMAVRTWANPARTGLLGVGMSTFALCVGLLIVVVRHTYFQTYPEQLLATRYVVWSSLFWSGLLLATVAHARRGKRELIAVCCLGIALLPSQVWMWQLSSSLRQVAGQTALAATIGVVDAEMNLGENVPLEIQRAVPLLRDAHSEMFAWPEAEELGAPLKAADTGVVAAEGIEVHVINNRLGAPARRITFKARSSSRRLLLVDADGIVRGLAERQVSAAPDHWIGWMEGGTERPSPSVYALTARQPH